MAGKRLGTTCHPLTLAQVFLTGAFFRYKNTFVYKDLSLF